MLKKSYLQNLKMNQLNDFIIEIIKVIINRICYSEKNYMNFKKIIVPLLSSLDEINHVLSEEKNELYNNNIFSLLYIIIVSSSIPIAVKKAYIMITDINDVNKLNLNFDDLIFNINPPNIKFFQWYSLILYIYIEFILLVYNDYNMVPTKMIEQIIKLYEEEVDKRDKIKKRYINKTIELYIGSLRHLCDSNNNENSENSIFKSYDNVHNLSYFLVDNFHLGEECLLNYLNIIKVYFNLADFGLIKIEKINENNNNNNNNIANSNKIEINDDNSKPNIRSKDIFILNENNNNNEMKKISSYNENDLINKVCSNSSFTLKFRELFITLKSIFREPNYYDNDMKIKINKIFKDYFKHKNDLKEFFIETNKDLANEAELIIKEFTDYHRVYHKLMKNLFIYNKLWSDKKLYFNEEKKKLLKYKSINYYTKNFQRPLLFPVNDYKNRYPSLTNFEIKDDFYYQKEYKDDYNFELDCPELDDFSMQYEEEIMNKINNDFQFKINVYSACLVKRTHHVKGKLLLIDKNGLISKIFFYGYPYKISKDTPCCNVSNELEHLNFKKEKICYGQILVCPKKDMNIKIIIDINDIQLIMERIYFYNKSAIEIYTNTKSYFFNLAEDNKSNKTAKYHCENIINMLSYYSQTVFFPIKLKDNIIGYSRNFSQIIKEYSEKKKEDLMEIDNKYILTLIDYWESDKKDFKLSTFDMLIHLNILSNRSYIDIFQYPVFPVLFFFYEKEENNANYDYLERKLDTHIGLQNSTENQRDRRDMIMNTYNEAEIVYEENKENNDEFLEIPYYFKTYYSNNVYTTNFLIRFFPYSFLAIELQGDNFDTPDRLFFSIKETFNNISYQKSDLRELIPEFYYFPEMFMNINKINFHKRSNGLLVDDVEMPINNNVEMLINDNDNNDNKMTNKNFYCFKFVENMRNSLESKRSIINDWINIIFGINQRYEDIKNKKGQYFNTYINFSKEEEKNYEKNRKDPIAMATIEFGITPVQILFKELKSNKNDNYNKTYKELKNIYKKKCGEFIDKIKAETEDNIKEDRILIKDNLKIKKCYEGKVAIYINDELYDELYDHSQEITHIYYNIRLNMFCTTSKDGFLCLYIYPNKLVTTIKNQNGNYFNKVFLSSNPFPSIIAYDKINNELISYSINGFFITRKKLNYNKLWIFDLFDENGGVLKDRLIIIHQKDKQLFSQTFTVPFLEEEEEYIKIL